MLTLYQAISNKKILSGDATNHHSKEKIAHVLVTVNFQYLLVIYIKGWMYRFAYFTRDISVSVLLRFNVTNHVSAHCNNLIRSALSPSAEETGSSTMIKRLVSSANKRMQEPISLTMSFMKIRKSNGQSIEPCGTPANIFAQ